MIWKYLANIRVSPVQRYGNTRQKSEGALFSDMEIPAKDQREPLYSDMEIPNKYQKEPLYSDMHSFKTHILNLVPHLLQNDSPTFLHF